MKSATKKQAQAVEGETLKVMSAEEIADAAEPCAELVKISSGFALAIADAKIAGHVLTFSPYYADLLKLEDELVNLNPDDPTEEDAVAAKELKSKYRQIRLDSAAKKSEVKKDILVEGRLLDKLDNAVTDAAKSRELKCEAIEKHRENKENERRAEIKKTRKEALEAFDYDTDFLTLEDMSEESYLKLLSKAQTIKEGLGAKEKLDEIEEQKRVSEADKLKSRVNLITALGFVLDTSSGMYESPDGSIGEGAIKTTTDATFDEWATAIASVRNKRLEAANNAANAAREKQEREKNRINAVSGAGLIYDPATEVYEGYGCCISLADIIGLNADDFTDLFKTTKEAILKKKAADKKADDERKAEEKKTKDENDRLKQEKADQEAKERAAAQKIKDDAEKARLAPDKEKFKAFYLSFKALVKTFPEFESEAAKLAGARFKEAVSITLKVALEEAGKLA